MPNQRKLLAHPAADNQRSLITPTETARLGFPARQVKTGREDLQNHKAGRGPDGQDRRDPRQRRQDQPRHAEDLYDTDEPDDRHRDGGDLSHHRRELFLTLNDLFSAGVEIEETQQSGNDPVPDDHGVRSNGYDW